MCPNRFNLAPDSGTWPAGAVGMTRRAAAGRPRMRGACAALGHGLQGLARSLAPVGPLSPGDACRAVGSRRAARPLGFLASARATPAEGRVSPQRQRYWLESEPFAGSASATGRIYQRAFARRPERLVVGRVGWPGGPLVVARGLFETAARECSRKARAWLRSAERSATCSERRTRREHGCRPGLPRRRSAGLAGSGPRG